MSHLSSVARRLTCTTTFCLFGLLVPTTLEASGSNLLQQAMAAFQSGNLPDAEHFAREALKAAPKDRERAEAANFLGIILGQQHRYDEAIAVFLANTRENPDDVDAQANLAEALRRAGRPAEAIPPLEKALALSPDSPLYALKLRLARIQSGQDAPIEEQAAAELKKSPPPPDWLITSAAIALHRHDWAEAAAILLHARRVLQRQIYDDIILDPAFSSYSARPELSAVFSIKNHTQPAGPLTTKAFSAYNNGDFPSALGLATQAAEAGESPAHIETVRGAIFFAQNKFTESAAAFEKAVAESPKDATLHLNLGEALRASGSPQEASQALQEALVLSPGNEIFATKLAFALIEANQAAAVLEKGLVKVSAGPLLIAKAAAAARQGELAQAAALLSAARKALPLPMYAGLVQDPIFRPYRDTAELKTLLAAAAQK
jgi:tetratricopeptide (TPR) repeat protein